jgi:hypothetical protein
MKKHILILTAIAAAIATTALGVDSVDVMLRKIFGTDTPPSAPRLALTAHALVGKDNRVVVNAYHGGLEFQGSTFDSKATTFAITNPTASRTVTFPDGSGTVALHRTAVLTAGATVSFAPASSVSCYTLTPGESETINAVTTGAVSGRTYYVVITTSGTTSRTLTFGTNFKTTGTLATGTTTAKTFVIHFIFDGTNFIEVSRTTAM